MQKRLEENFSPIYFLQVMIIVDPLEILVEVEEVIVVVEVPVDLVVGDLDKIYYYIFFCLIDKKKLL